MLSYTFVSAFQYFSVSLLTCFCRLADDLDTFAVTDFSVLTSVMINGLCL